LLIELEKLSEANELMKRIDNTSPNLRFIKAKLLAASNDQEEALRLMGDDQNLQIIGLLGLKNKGSIFFHKAIEQDRINRTSYFWLYKTSHCYDKLRDDPGFQDFLSKHNKIYEENLANYGNLDL